MTPADDSSAIVRGFRMGVAPASERSVALEAAVADADGTLSPETIERIAHADWDQATWEENAEDLMPSGPGSVGFARLYPSPESTQAHSLAASWFGWLPGIYGDRTAALVAYGYVLGGEHCGLLDMLSDRIVVERQRLITEGDLADFCRVQAAP